MVHFIQAFGRKSNFRSLLPIYNIHQRRWNSKKTIWIISEICTLRLSPNWMKSNLSKVHSRLNNKIGWQLQSADRCSVRTHNKMSDIIQFYHVIAMEWTSRHYTQANRYGKSESNHYVYCILYMWRWITYSIHMMEFMLYICCSKIEYYVLFG